MRIIAVVAFLLVASGSAHAQLGNPIPLRITAVDSALNNYVSKEVRDIANSDGGTSSARPPSRPTARRVAISASDFKPSRSRPVVDAFLASSELDFIDADDLRPVIDQTFVSVEASFRKHNVATAIGFALAVSVLISRDVDLDEAGMLELIASVNDSLAAAPGFHRMKASDRQMIYDSMILTGAVLIAMHTLGKRDPDMRDKAIELANSVLGQLGVTQAASAEDAG